MPIEFAVLGLLTESLDKIVKVVVGGGQLADFKHIPHLLCFLVVHGLISPKSGYSEYPEWLCGAWRYPYTPHSTGCIYGPGKN